MVNPSVNLVSELFLQEMQMSPTRQGYGEGVVIAGEEDERVVVLSADLTESTRSILFKERFPDRFVEVGVAEQALATIAAGMANYGKIPFISSYAAFSPGRNWEQIRTTAALNNVPVKIVGAHAGISVGPDGATHQALEDLALMRVIPNMVVMSPCDAIEAKKATVAMAKISQPAYIRLAREKTAQFTTEETPFEIGKMQIFWQGKDPQVGIVATGPLVYEALRAAKLLEDAGVESIVVNCHTIKPLDEETLVSVARRTGCIVTVEEHQIAGGLGGVVAETLAKVNPIPMQFVGMPDHFGESGKPDELLEKFRMTFSHIVTAAKKAISLKHSLNG